MTEVAGKVAFITGGSSGIGLGIARAFAEAGMKVVIGYRTKTHLDDALKVLDTARDRVHAINIDVTDRPGMQKAATETVQVFGKVHVLINSAGVLGLATLSGTSYDDWDWMINVNVNGVFNTVRAFLPHIRAHGEGGQIITTASIGGLVASGASVSGETAKFAVVGMMESLRAELAEASIGVSLFCPGMVRSNLADSNRNRPASQGESSFDQGTMAALNRAMANPEVAMDPLRAGQFALRGMRNNDLYILTNPEYEPIIRDRSEALLASFPNDVQPTATQLVGARRWQETSMYRIERDRRLCAQQRLNGITK